MPPRRREESLLVKAAVAEQLRDRGKIGKATKMQIPTAREREYRVALLRMQRKALDIARALFFSQLESIQREALDSVRMDAFARRIETLMNDVRVGFAQEVTAPEIAAIADRAARQVELFNAVQLNRVFKTALNIDVDALFPDAAAAIEAFTADNVSLITSISENYFKEIEQTALRNLRAGRRVSEWRGELAKRYQVSQSRAALIARDQTNKFNGELNRARQMSLGVRTYTWRDSNDERVRETHQEFDGQTFAWQGEPRPPEGHPGQPINCRCNADPDVESVLTSTEQKRL